MDNSLDPDRSLFGQLLWSADPATQNAISLVLAAAVLALLFVYAPLLVRLVRLYLVDRSVREACQLDDRPAEAHREEISRAFARSPVESQWDEFVYRWRASLAEGERQRAPVRLLDVFDDRPVIPTGAIKSLLPALPGLFLAVGVLGSFVGLAAAVSTGGAQDGAANTALVADRVGLALRSGLWGLLLSITAVVGGRLIEGVFDRLAEALDHTVERAFGAVSTGELSSLSARAQRDALADLGVELKRFTSELTERMDRGLQRIEDSTASAASLVSEEQRGALRNVVHELSVQVQTGVEQHLSSLNDVLRRAVDHQGAVTGGLAEAFDQMAANAQVHSRVTQNLEQSAHSVREAATSMSGTAHDLAPVLEHLRETGVALSATASTMNTTQHVVSHTAEEIRGSIDHSTAALFEQRQFIETSLDEIRTTLEMMSTGLGDNLTQALRNVDNALEHTVGRLRETIEHSNETIDRLALPVRAAEGTTREMQTALERVRDEVLALGEWMGQAVRPLRTNLTQIEDRAGDITRALTQFGDHAMHVDKTMDALRGEIHEEGRRFRSSTSELTRHLQMAAEASGGAARGAPPARPTRPTSSGATPTGGAQRGDASPTPDTGASRPSARIVAKHTPATRRPTGPDAHGQPEEPEIVIDDAPGSQMHARHDDDEPTGPGAAASSETASSAEQSSPSPLPIRVHATSSPDAADASTEIPQADEKPVRSTPPRISAAAANAAAQSGPAAGATRSSAAPHAHTPAASGSAAPSPAPSTAPSGAAGPSGAQAGNLLGPDPYARGADAAASLDRQRQILESGRTMHRLEIDDPSGPGAPSDDLTLSGLLRKTSGASTGSSTPSSKQHRRGRKGRADEAEASDDAGSNDDDGRPRTWQLLGKD